MMISTKLYAGNLPLLHVSKIKVKVNESNILSACTILNSVKLSGTSSCGSTQS